ncbi:MAG: carbohydrate kinase family protein [Anaerovoracaceae bacterium]
MTNKETRPRAAVAGALSVDICPTFINEEASSFDDVIKPGAITRITGSEVHPGGPVANTGIALSIFGVDPVLCARVGRDDFGKMVLSMLSRSAGEDAAGGVIEGDGFTAYSVILAPRGLDRAILQNPGANDLFSADDIDWDRLRGCGLLHFGHPSTMKKIYENDGEGLLRILRGAKERGMLTSLDLCAVDPGSDAGRCDWRAILGRVLPYTDFFVPSIDEVREILMPGERGDEIRDAEKIAGISRGLGARNVLIKCGARGMYFENAGAEFFGRAEETLGVPQGSLASWADVRGARDAVKVKKEVSGLGAGDTSIAAYLAALMRGMPFERAAELAVTEGALCVTCTSATGGLRPFEEV